MHRYRYCNSIIQRFILHSLLERTTWPQMADGGPGEPPAEGAGVHPALVRIILQLQAPYGTLSI